MALGYDGSIRIKAALDHSDFDRGVSGMGKSVDKLSNTIKKIGGLVATAFSVTAIVNFGKEAINAASNLSNAWQGLQSIVEGQGRSFSAAQGFIQDYISDGLVPLENAVTAYKNLAARGYDDTQIQQTMTALKDAAAFGRQASYSLGDAVTSATEGLKNENSILVDNAGVTKNVAKMWDDYAKSIGTTANKLTQQQKIQAEVNGILEETKFQAGDAAKVAGTYSGQVSSLSYNFQNLKVAVGNALLPIAQAVIPAINAIIQALTRLANAFAKVTALIFGKSPEASGAGGAQSKMASTASAAADSANELANAEANAGDAAKQAEKDMKGVLADFDDLHVLADDTAESVGNAAGGLDDMNIDTPNTGGANLFEQPQEASEIEKRIQGIIDRAKELWDIFKQGFDFGLGDVDFEKIRESIRNVSEMLMGIFTDSKVTEAASRFVDSFVYMLGTISGSAVSVGATIVEALFGGLEMYLEENSDRIREWIVRMFDVRTEINGIIADYAAAFANVFSVFGDENGQRIVASITSIFSDAFMGVTELATKFGRDVLDLITGPFIENQELIKETLDGFLEPIAGLMESIAGLLQETVDKIVALYDEQIYPWIQTVKEAFTEWFEHLLNGFNTYIKPVLDDFAKKFDEVVNQHVKPMVDKIIEYLKKGFELLQYWWNNLLKPLVSWIIDTAYPFVANAIQGIGETFTNIVELISDLVGDLFEVLGGIIDFVTGVFTGDWERAWEGVKSVFSGVWNGIADIVEGVLNGIINTINVVIRGINTLLSKLSIFGVSGGLSEISHVNIPHLANGAVVPPGRQFAAILGDNKRETEVVSPLSTIKQALSEALRESGGMGGDVHVTVELDGKVVARNTVKHINGMTRATGKPVLLI